MAFPTIPTGGRVVTGVQANTTATRTFPSLTGLTKNAGDLLIAICCGHQSASGGTAGFSSWGAGFTEFTDQSPGTNAQIIGAAYKVSDGTESGTFTVAQATASGQAVFILLSIPGAGSPPEAGTIAGGTAAAANPGSFDPSWGTVDTLWIAVGTCAETDTAGAFAGATTAPTNYGNTAATAISADAIGGLNAAVAFRQLNAASEDVGTWTVDTSNAKNAALLIGVPPAPAGDAWTYDQPDTITGTDASVRVAGKKPADTITGTDSPTRTVAYVRAIADGIQGTDARSTKPGKAIGDSIQATDATVPYTPSGVLARRFISDPGGESGDDLRTAIGACNLNGGATLVAWVRKVNDPPVREMFVATHTSAGASAADLSTGIIPDEAGLLAYNTHSTKVGDELEFVRSDGWAIVAFVHPAGTNTWGRFHALKDGGSWEHVEAKETASNRDSQAGGSVRFASISGFAYTDLEIAAAALWTTALSDGQIEELTTSLTDWLAHSVPPAGLWRFNQSSIGTALVDLTGNGANQTSIDGTVVSIDGPPEIDYDIAFARSVDDTAQGTDAITGKAITKTIADSIQGTDSASPELGVGGVAHDLDLDDAIQGTDARSIAALYARLLADTAQATDSSIRAPRKLLGDLAAATDASAAFRGIPLAISDSIQGTDARSRIVVKTIVDAAMIADVLQGVEQNRHSLSDDVAATDSIRRHLAKALADVAAGTDVSTRKPAKGIADSAQGTDASSRKLTKALADAATLTDDTDIAAEGQYEVDIDDAIQGTDASVRRPTKAIADVAAGTDARAKAVTRATIADAIQGTDAASRRPAKSFSDSLAATDATGRVFDADRTIADAIQGTDDIDIAGTGAHALELDDAISGTDAVARSAGYYRSTADSIQGTDVHARAPGVRLADLLAGADALERQLALLRTISDLAYVTDAIDVLRPDWTYGGKVDPFDYGTDGTATYGGDGDFAYAGVAAATYGGDDDWTYSEEDSH